jgi:hypothetical protein
VWIDVALGEAEEAKKIIASVPKRHTFDIKYEQIVKINWESFERVYLTMPNGVHPSTILFSG